MIMIRTHLIATQSPTRIYEAPDLKAQTISTVPKDSWLGELERQDDWIKVIGIDFEGWVRKSDVEVLSSMGLHAIWRPGKPIAYMRLSNAS